VNGITVYTTNTCPYYTMLKNFPDDKGIAYKEVNVQKDPIADKGLSMQLAKWVCRNQT
jgi:glutaredoxin 3